MALFNIFKDVVKFLMFLKNCLNAGLARVLHVVTLGKNLPLYSPDKHCELLGPVGLHSIIMRLTIHKHTKISTHTIQSSIQTHLITTQSLKIDHT